MFRKDSMPEQNEPSMYQNLYTMKKAQLLQYLLALDNKITGAKVQLSQMEKDREQAIGGMAMLEELMQATIPELKKAE
jgi:hypothetical protein